MPDPIFAHPRLALVYDTFDGVRGPISTPTSPSKSGAEQVTWIEGDASSIPQATRADVVVMASNA